MNIHSPDKTVAKTRTTPPPVPPPITSQSVPVPPLEPFKIQTHPTSKTQGVIQGAMQSILNLPSRGQFYLLYGVTLLFILILLTLVIGQTADIGIFRLVFGTAKTNSSPNTPNQPNPASNNNGNSPEIKNDTYHASASDAEEKRRQEEEQKQLEAAQTQLAEQVNAFRKEIEKKKKQAQTKLNDFLLEPVLPPFLSMSVPMVRENQENNETIETNTAKELQLSSPPVKKFSELDVLFPFGLALDLKWIPLLDIPNVRVETRKLKLQRKLNSEQNQEDEIESLLETASEPEIKTGAKDSRDSKDSKYSDEFMVPEDRWFRWTVIAVDTETTTETPMFALELTEEGLAVTWQAEGLDNLRLYDTLTASLGFLRVQTENGDVNKNVDRATIRSIPLFEPKIQQPIRLAEHFADTEKPELITETPFAVPLWKTFFNTAKIPFAFQLNVTVKPELPENVKEVKLPKLESPAQFLAEFQTNIDSKKSMGAGNETFTPIAVSFDATLAPEQIVWRDRYNNQIEMLNQEKESKHNNLETIKKENETINKDLLTKGGTAASELRKKRNELSTEIKNTEIRIKEIESILANIPAAHESLIKDEQLRFEYSAYLIPFSREEDKVSDRLRNEESLLLMKTQSPPPISEQKNE
jgi:hypothetical protein